MIVVLEQVGGLAGSGAGVGWADERFGARGVESVESQAQWGVVSPAGSEETEEGEPVVYGYQIRSTTSYKTYNLDAELLTCDCPDFTFRRGTAEHPHCKHLIALAQFRYASMLEKGHGVKKDLAQARRFYLAAATQGNAKAMHNLAVLYAEGIDGRPDYATAVQWFRKAAAYGISDSEYNLGVLTARGLGTEKNLTDSYKWFALAAAQGDKEAARKRDEVASQMDATSAAAAQRAVKSFVVKPQPHDAVAVAVPPGGWDDAATPAAHGKTRSGPLALGTYKLGRR